MLLLFQLKAKDNGYPITTASLCLPGNVLRQDKFSTSYIVYKIRYIVFTTYFNWFISLEIFFTFPSSSTIIDITVYNALKMNDCHCMKIKKLLYTPFVDDFALGAKQFMVVYMLKRFDYWSTYQNIVFVRAL